MEKIKKAIEAAKRTAKNMTNEPSEIKLPTQEYKSTDTKNKLKKTKFVSLNHEHLAKNRIVSYNKNIHLSMGFDILRTQVIKKMKENGWRTLAITSPIPGCGKTVVSINLAMSIAHNTNTTCMLVDFDLRRPKVAKYLGLPNGPSLNDVLANEACVEDALIRPGLERMVVLPTANPVSHSAEVLSSKKVGNIISEIGNRYPNRIVIFDLSPVLGTDDAMTVLSQVDCALVIVGNGMVSKTELTESMRYIEKEKLLGSVLNKVEKAANKNDYYDY